MSDCRRSREPSIKGKLLLNDMSVFLLVACWCRLHSPRHDNRCPPRGVAQWRWMAARLDIRLRVVRLGHASVGITLDLYSHVLPSMQQDAARAFDELF